MEHMCQICMDVYIVCISYNYGATMSNAVFFFSGFGLFKMSERQYRVNRTLCENFTEFTYMDGYDTYRHIWIHMDTYGGPRARPWPKPKTTGSQGPWPICARRQFWARAWLLGPYMYPYVCICVHMCPYVSICFQICIYSV